MKNPQEVHQEREAIRQTILSSLRLIVQSQYVLADLQENQKRLEQLLEELGEPLKESGDAPTQ